LPLKKAFKNNIDSWAVDTMPPSGPMMPWPDDYSRREKIEILP